MTEVDKARDALMRLFTNPALLDRQDIIDGDAEMKASAIIDAARAVAREEIERAGRERLIGEGLETDAVAEIMQDALGPFWRTTGRGEELYAKVCTLIDGVCKGHDARVSNVVAAKDQRIAELDQLAEDRLADCARLNQTKVDYWLTLREVMDKLSEWYDGEWGNPGLAELITKVSRALSPVQEEAGK